MASAIAARFDWEKRMIRFSIRELLLLTVAASLAIGWWVQARHEAANLAVLRAKVTTMESKAALLAKLQIQINFLNQQRGRYEKTRKLEQLLEPMDKKTKPPSRLHQRILEGNQT